MPFVPLSSLSAEDLLIVGYRKSETLCGKIIPKSMASSSQSARSKNYEEDAWEAWETENYDDQMTVVSSNRDPHETEQDPQDFEYPQKACYCCLCKVFIGYNASSQTCSMCSRMEYSSYLNGANMPSQSSAPDLSDGSSD
jgi:hypothetical protein